MAKLWSDWYDAVLPFLRGLPPGVVADFYIKRAAIEFCDRSLAWRVAIPAFQATAATGTYTLAAPVAGTTVVEVLELRFLGRELEQKTPEWLKDYYGPSQDWRAKTADPPMYMTCEFPNQVTIVPMPVSTTAAALKGWCAVKPLDTATGVDDNIWREYHDEVATLAKAMAMASPSKPYTDKVGAEKLRADIDSRLGFISLQRAKGAARAPFRTKTHWI